MDIYYNNTDKEAAIILGYGLGNHLSINFLLNTVKKIHEIFPKLTFQETNELRFFEVAQSSRRHKSMWYCSFPYDLGKQESYFRFGDELQHKGYAFSDYPGKKGKRPPYHDGAETAKSIMSRMIHD